MLLIGDLHLTSKIQDRLLEKLVAFVENHPEERSLIFLGDFVYHFSYDRKALAAFFDQCLAWYRSGKQLYLLAGNHDWLGQFFVFDEGKKAFELFQGGISFITEPCIQEIEGERILFFPHVLQVDLAAYPGIEDLADEWYHQMLATGKKALILSAKLDLLLRYFVQQYPGKLTVIHHYYFDGVSFPGQTSQFSFKDVALDRKWLQKPELQFISGHLHQAFCYGNYLCTGSVWATSPLEDNQLKFFWKWKNGQLEAYETGITTYLSVNYAPQV